MSYQKVAKKKKYWETPELIAARSEAVRLHTALKYPAIKIAKILGKNPNQIARWLTAADVYKPLTPKQIAEIQKFSIASAHEAILTGYKREISALEAIDRHTRVYLCKECRNIFIPVIGSQGCCSQDCRSKSYLKSPNGILSAKRAELKSSRRRKSKVERLYVTQNPKCNCCPNPIPFSIFFRHRDAKYCSRKCSQKALSESRKNDPIKAEKYKLIKKKTYLKRQLNGKNRLEKREYLRNNPQARIAKNLRTRLYLAVKRQGGKKCDSTRSLTGADWPTFSAWIENKFKKDMTWGNYGTWHVDHIDPCRSFDLTKPEQQRKCFHYTNLQPLWGSENIKKGSKIIPKQKVFVFDR
jgi:hypothetical protein